MLSELQQVIRLVMFLCRHGVYKQNKAQSRGGLLVLLSAQSGLLTCRRLTYTVAAAGRWFVKVARKGRMTEIVENLSSFISLCDCPYEEELCKFSDNFGSLHFVCSFQVDQYSQDVETETERFLQRVSLVNSQITIIFKMKNKENTHQQEFSRRTKSVMDHFIARDPTSYVQSPFSVGCFPSCCQMHLVLGERLTLLLPSGAVEAGLCGEMNVTSLATLGPCMNQYPNWPSRLSHIRVLVYSPSGIPIIRAEGQTQLSFLQSLAGSLFWGKLGLAGVRCADTHAAQGSLFYEMEFSTEDEHSSETAPVCSRVVSESMESDVRTVEQTITLFLLMEYSDPFHSQLFEFITSEETLERQLDRVLWHNAEKVRSAMQTLLENTLRVFLSRKKSREKLQSAMSVIVSSLHSIVSSSSSAEFRSACMNSMKVQNTNDLTTSLHQTLQRVIGGRFVSSTRCTPKKVVEAVVSEQNGSERLEQSLPGKRAYKETMESPVSSSKRWCSETIDRGSDFSESSWESVDPQMTLLSSEMAISRSSSTSLNNIDLKNQQVRS
ncbi:DUF4554 domain-containing protein [Pygocentrus nattereri]|uniref:DUF4554 domain-containing protein n=1 Tax=Pygocentrus nattereri TaxID=42514 RepID=UPI00189133DE|nr:DUF4554 domain-containing protein [Pygocentrus nattereri]